MRTTMWSGALVLATLLTICAGDAPWWSSAVYYRILVDSFKDGDGDGLGDIKGVTKKASYVRAIGADAIILSAVSARSTDCSRPGVVDHANIDQRYGNLDDLVTFLEKTKKLELKVVATLHLQSVSQASEWFGLSEKRANAYDNWFIWRDGNPDQPIPPENNVEWKWSETRGAYFATSTNEVLLNLCSEGVKSALSSAQCAWIRRGVSGILLNPDFTFDKDCGQILLRKLASDAITCARAASLDVPVVLVETLLSPSIATEYYGTGGIGANSVLSRAFASEKRAAAEIALEFYSSILNAPQDCAPAWLTSAFNESRIATRYGNEMVDAILLLSLILPGAIVIQQGDELGAADTFLEWRTDTTEQTCWPTPLVPSAAPFPWDDSPAAGFTTGIPWIPLSPNYRYANAKSEFANDFSHIGVVKVAAAMRKLPAIGPHAEIKRLSGALVILRWGNTGSLLAVSNVETKQCEVELSRIPGLPTLMTVAASSTGSGLSSESHVNTEKTLKLSPGETMLLAGAPRHCGGPGPVDKIANKLSEGWQKINKYFSNI